MTAPNLGGDLYFSTTFGIRRPERARWFDPILVRDNPLFVDPFLLDYAGEQEFEGASKELYDHFRRPFEMLAENPKAQTSDFLYFPEMPETCLGYAETGTQGAGSGRYFALEMRQAMVNAIKAGMESPKHFEEIGLLAKGLGPDRISDITTRVLAARFIRYTERIAKRLRIPTTEVRLWGYGNLKGRIVKVPVTGSLPRNPHSGRAIILVPKNVLRPLQTINRVGFEDYLWGMYSDDLRRDFNVNVKDELWPYLFAIANANLDWVRAYVDWEEARGPRPYPFKKDPAGFGPVGQFWYGIGRGTPPPAELSPKTDAEVLDFVRFLNRHFKEGIELRKGYETLYHDNECSRPRSEKMVQRVYGLMARGLCEVSGVTVTPETNAGSGPVDFMFATGYQAAVTLEVKLVSNSKFWDGSGAQLPQYMAEHDTKTGMFLAVAFRDKEVAHVRFTGLKGYVQQVAKDTGLTLDSETVDARPKPTSASKLKSKTPPPRRSAESPR